jgi:hypothetical protein
MVDDKAFTPDDLTALLAHLLAGAAGGKEAEWAELLTIERVNLTFHPHSNWRIDAKGSAGQREAVAKAADVVRVAHPYLAWSSQGNA